MKLINLCQYTLRQSLSDSGKYTALPFITAQDIVNYLNEKMEVK